MMLQIVLPALDRAQGFRAAPPIADQCGRVVDWFLIRNFRPARPNRHVAQPLFSPLGRVWVPRQIQLGLSEQSLDAPAGCMRSVRQLMETVKLKIGTVE